MTRRDCIALAAAALPGGLLQAAPGPQTLLILGDSLSAEYGLPRGKGWVALLQQRLEQTLQTVNVINASVSGETTAGGLTRLPALLAKHHPTHVVIELGANDALRGLPLDATRSNLRAMVQAVNREHARTLLIGIQVPPNYGPEYTRDLGAAFAQVAQVEKTALVPFMLAGIADAPDARRWFQADGLHPIAQAHPKILENIWGVLQPWLKTGR